MEWGPRALGHRSILADPRRADMKEILNAKIKRRESFRPFAPSILREAVGEWFEQEDDVPFMMEVFQIRPKHRELIPAVTHVDGSGRLHTVTRETNPRYYGVIEHFRDLTEVPMVLNTSFNENEPIVCYPEEALECFLRTKMDVLVLENFFLDRTGDEGGEGQGQRAKGKEEAEGQRKKQRGKSGKSEEHGAKSAEQGAKGKEGSGKGEEEEAKGEEGSGKRGARSKSTEQGEKGKESESKEEEAKGEEESGKGEERGAKSTEQGAKSKEESAKGKEEGARSGEQLPKAEAKEQGTTTEDKRETKTEEAPMKKAEPEPPVNELEIGGA